LSGKVAELETKVATLTKANEKRSEPITAGDNYHPDLSGRVRELEAQLAAVPKNRAPAYPDLSGRVRELETQLTDASSETARARRETAALAKAKDEPRAPAYPDLPRPASPNSRPSSRKPPASRPPPRPHRRGHFGPAKAPGRHRGPPRDSLRGYALLEKERDALQANPARASDALTAKVATLTTQVEQLQSSSATAQAEKHRLSDSLAALQRSTGQVAGDAASNRALVQQLQGSNAVLAQENYQLKTARLPHDRPVDSDRPGLRVTAAARIHVVASGDSLSKISQRYYGTAAAGRRSTTPTPASWGPTASCALAPELRIP